MPRSDAMSSISDGSFYSPSNSQPSDTDLESASHYHRRRQLRSTATKSCLSWNTEYAVAYLVNHLRSTDDDDGNPAAAAIDTARRYPVPPQQWTEFPGLVFPDLSEAVFAGRLNDRVVISWEPMDERLSGRTFPADTISSSNAVVQLNPLAMQGANRDEIVGTLLHHMIHAYFLTVCSDQSDGDDEEDWRLGHGEPFAAVLWEIRAQAAKGVHDRERPLPIGFGHRLPRACSSSSSVLSGNRSRTSGSSRSGGGISNCSSQPFSCSRSSHCPLVVPTTSKEDTESWYANECQPFVSAPLCLQGDVLYQCNHLGEPRLTARRSAAGTSRASTFVEFVYDGNKPIKVPRGMVNEFPSLRARFEHGAKRWIEVPRWVTQPVLVAMMAFLNKQAYRPLLDHVQERGGRGPPVIRTAKSRAAAARARGGAAVVVSSDEDDGSFEYLMHDIRIHKLAVALCFSELAAYALRRLYHQHFTHEDPISVLKQVYARSNAPTTIASVGEADMERVRQEPLRAWARAFLQRRDHALGASNLTKLGVHSEYMRRWEALLAKGGQLLEDVKRTYAEERIAQQYAGMPQPLYAHHSATAPAMSSALSSASSSSSGGGGLESSWQHEDWRRFWRRGKPQQRAPPAQPLLPAQYQHHHYSPSFQWWVNRSPQYPYSWSPTPPMQYYPLYASPPPQPPSQVPSSCSLDAPSHATSATIVATTAATAKRQAGAVAEQDGEDKEEDGNTGGCRRRKPTLKMAVDMGAARLSATARRHRHSPAAAGGW